MDDAGGGQDLNQWLGELVVKRANEFLDAGVIEEKAVGQALEDVVEGFDRRRE